VDLGIAIATADDEENAARNEPCEDDLLKTTETAHQRII
jgi:hypothetical protein